MSIETFLMDKNIAKNEKQAQMIMIGVIVLCLLFIIVRIGGNGSSSNANVELTPEEQALIDLETAPGGEFDPAAVDADAGLNI